MITKMTLSPLDTFHTVMPTKWHPYGYALTVSPLSFRMNQKCFEHFKGHQYFKLMMRKHDLAVVAVNKGDPDAVRVSIRKYPNRSKHGYYDVVSNKGLQKRIMARLANPPRKHATRLKVEDDNVGSNYIIFDMDNE